MYIDRSGFISKSTVQTPRHIAIPTLNFSELRSKITGSAINSPRIDNHHHFKSNTSRNKLVGDKNYTKPEQKTNLNILKQIKILIKKSNHISKGEHRSPSNKGLSENNSLYKKETASSEARNKEITLRDLVLETGRKGGSILQMKKMYGATANNTVEYDNEPKKIRPARSASMNEIMLVTEKMKLVCKGIKGKVMIC